MATATAARPARTTRPTRTAGPQRSTRPDRADRAEEAGRPQLEVVGRRRRSPLTPAITIALMAALIAFGAMAVQISLIHRQQRLDRLHEQIDTFQLKNKELREKEVRLQSPSEILRIARDELGMVESRPPALVTPEAEKIAPATPSPTAPPTTAAVGG